MRRRVITLAAATAMTTASLPATASSRAAVSFSARMSEPRKPTVRLTVDTTTMGDEAETTREWVLRDGAVKLAAAGLDVSEDAAELDVRVIVVPKDLGYTVALEIWEDGAMAPILKREPQACETCTRTELVKLIERELSWAGGWLSRRDTDDEADEGPPEEPQGAAQETQSVGSRAESTAPASDEPGRKLHALGWAGVGVGVVGLGTLTGGLVVSLRPYEAKGEPGDYRVPRLEHPQRLGWALVGIGAAAAVGGAVMLAFDLKKNRARTLGVGPWLDRQAAGLWVRRSF